MYLSFFFSSRRRHTRCLSDWSSDVCSSDLEGTSIRAAEGGVVAYAGNELKGYGNLVLIRHEGGWVTAYAHNQDLFVKRGDTVKRGDVISKAGQTGSVSSPQVHFEVRKGATAMDPMRFLNGSTAAN